MNKVYQVITDRILKSMEEGTIPWSKPWVGSDKGERYVPQNFVSKRPYSGVNRLLLSMAPYTCPYWITYKKAAELGGQVRKGEKSTPIVFWKATKYEKDGEERSSFILRYFNVFNLEQVDGIGWSIEDAEPAGIQSADEIVEGYEGPAVVHDHQDRAYYTPAADRVMMPMVEQFPQKERYYQVLFHELAHSTGHESRLNRTEVAKVAAFGDERYAQEELTAEMASCFLCAEADIEPAFDDSAAYIKGWMEKIKDDPEMVVKAASKAEKAVKYILAEEE